MGDMSSARETWVAYKDPETGIVKVIPKADMPPRSNGRLQIIPDLQPYKNVIDGKVIAGRRQHREFLQAHGVVEVGNEKPRARPDTSNRVDVGLVQELKRNMGVL